MVWVKTRHVCSTGGSMRRKLWKCGKCGCGDQKNKRKDEDMSGGRTANPPYPHFTSIPSTQLRSASHHGNRQKTKTRREKCADWKSSQLKSRRIRCTSQSVAEEIHAHSFQKAPTVQRNQSVLGWRFLKEFNGNTYNI